MVQSRDANRAYKQRRMMTLCDISVLELKPKHPQYRKRALKNLRFFCEHYFPQFFSIPWADFHISLLEDIQMCIEKDASKAIALPRGSGKTTILTVASIWAILSGRKNFGVMVAANQRRADALVDDIAILLQTNEVLAEDFPEVCEAFKMTVDTNRTSVKINYAGANCHMILKHGEITFPKVPGSLCSEARIVGAGLDGAGLRGLSQTTSEGVRRRPDFVLLDDPQTRESAESESQTEKRMSILLGDVYGMAGAGKKMSIFVACTVIQRGDLADKILNRKITPWLRGDKYSLLPSLPERIDLWDEYNRIRTNSFIAGGFGDEATEFYKEHMEEMKEGAECTWWARKNTDELDGLQYAMNIYYTNKDTFNAEYQNDPSHRETYQLAFTSEHCKVACNGLKRMQIKSYFDKVVAHIDVHKNLLFYTLMAVNDQLDGAIIDYGAYPKQNREIYTTEDATVNIMSTHPGKLYEDALAMSLNELLDDLFTRDYTAEDGTVLNLEKCAIDANWSTSKLVVYRTIYDSPYRSRLIPAHGVYLSAKSKPFGYGYDNKLDQVIDGARIPRKPGDLGLRYAIADANKYKTMLINKLTAPRGTQGRISIFGSSANEHKLWQKHIAAEYAVEVEYNGKIVTEWHERKGQRHSSHWLDNAYWCLVLATFESKDLKIRDKLNTASGQARSFAAKWKQKSEQQKMYR